MWNIKEEDLDQFRITCRNRLSPEGATGFMLGTIFYTSLFMVIIFIGGIDYYTTLFDKVIVRIELVLYGLQVMFLILYLFPKARYKFRKLQTLVILLYAFQLGTIGCTLFVLSGMIENSIDLNTRVYVGLLVLGGIIVHIVTTVDTFKQASEGAFSSGDKSDSFFSKTKGHVIQGAVIYVLILLVLIYINNNYSLNTMFGYVMCNVVMYAVAIGAAEFQLLVYCRFKFKSFNMKWEENERKCGRIRKQNKKSKTKNK
ncbi:MULTISPECIES: hypothetical protein [unclassified Bacillus (in: firmicutes)]|uniref:hypothetical protein n=1 Tax=unclassified Bacillus (in: firmicutes) TaxID=185979 RepID=UPI00032E91CC|nr:hypothetical protein [Bacillus wiedmannii]EOP09790.1 hypothetical protein ICS_03533 [Bacillus cereus BAG2O-3]EOQ12416.1 hypothetical protein KQ3_01357 [Bacillus cereus B5-2]PEW25997.1 hypothetical protein CN431_30190 [Bacillus cereus]RFB47764.1 hypothetical protein DZB83_11055 [Bacillus sp. dmp10]RFB67729.1 hypothetical protein DZB94_29935 [Bacillus sp. AW]HDR8172438.1 hypothetical protein [Bacillus thuringiensis]